jgi:dienelactone hydrolase
MRKLFLSAVFACIVTATFSLSGCGGSDSPVQGTATPVPDTDSAVTDNTPASSPTPTPTPVPAPASDATQASRFIGVAPATTDSPKYIISPAIAYQLGTVVTSTNNTEKVLDADGQPVIGKDGKPVMTDSGPIAIPVQGWLRYPVAAASADATRGRFPIVLFLHGQHTPKDPSYQGYDYLAQDLARQGYVVVSIDANAINGSGQGDPSSQSRAQLLLGTLDRMRQVDANGGPGVLTALRGKLDFDRIGIMGHSRGGQGVAYAIKYNMSRKGVTRKQFIEAIAAKPSNFSAYPDLVAAVGDGTDVDTSAFDAAMTRYNIFYAADGESVPPYDIRAGMMLAPTDFSQVVGLSNVPLAMVAPSCDGDVISQDGAHAFDMNRFATQYDTAPRYQVMVNGANHDYFNTVWVIDDALYSEAAANLRGYCYASRDGTPRLSADDQRRVGVFLIDSFMRYFVGDETQFASYWNGVAQLPPAACPGGAGTCDERVLLTVQKDASRSKLVQRFQSASTLDPNTLGGALTLTGFDQLSACSIPYAPTSWRTPSCSPASPHEFTTVDHMNSKGRFGGGGYLSISDALRLTWSSPNAKIGADLKGVSAATYDSLTFRIAVVRPMGQEVIVTLTDGKGVSATVNASDFSDALYLAPKPKGAGRPLTDDPEDAPYASTGTAVQLLNMVSIPLAAFAGVDKSNLARVEFALPKASGMIAFTDLEFQSLGR